MTLPFYQRIFMRLFVLTAAGLLVVSCHKPVDPQGANTEPASRQYMPTALSDPHPYQAPSYHALLARDPFVSVGPQVMAVQPQPPVEPSAKLGCEPKLRPQNIAQTWALRATFNGGPRPSALIDIPNTGIISTRVGQQLITQATHSQSQPPQAEQIEVLAIKSQQVILKHLQGVGSDCLHTERVTLNLYD